MLSAEQFELKRAELSSPPPSGLFLPQTARDSVRQIMTEDGREIESFAFIQKEERFYKLSRLGPRVKIEGVFIPKHTRNAALLDTLGEMRPMTKIFIDSSGTIVAGGQRISPLDERLSLLVNDLMNGDRITEDVYNSKVQKVSIGH